MRGITSKKYAISLYESIKDASREQIPDIIKSFIAVVTRNKDMKKINKIVKAFRNYYNQEEGVQEVRVRTAKTFEASVKDNIIRILTESMKQKVELQELVEPELMGGLVLEYGDNVVDGSIKKRIELLAESLK